MKKRKKNNKKRNSNFCRRTDCYYNNGKFKCESGNRVETKNEFCIFYTKNCDCES